MTAAHLPLLPRTCEAGRNAKSVHAVAANDSWTDTSVRIAVFWPELKSSHLREYLFFIINDLSVVQRYRHENPVAKVTGDLVRNVLMWQRNHEYSATVHSTLT